MIYNDPKYWPKETVPIGYTETITESGQWECPATGTWQVEMHGGGGGGFSGQTAYCTGGGSGEIYTATYGSEQIISVTIGTGGAGKKTTNYTGSGSSGETTTFGDLSIGGGGGAYFYDMSIWGGGSAKGSIATKGTTGSTGGYGNKDNPEQIYGNGGARDHLDGYPGAVILTYLGA